MYCMAQQEDTGTEKVTVRWETVQYSINVQYVMYHPPRGHHSDKSGVQLFLLGTPQPALALKIRVESEEQTISV